MENRQEVVQGTLVWVSQEDIVFPLHGSVCACDQSCDIPSKMPQLGPRKHAPKGRPRAGGVNNPKGDVNVVHSRIPKWVNFGLSASKSGIRMYPTTDLKFAKVHS